MSRQSRDCRDMLLGSIFIVNTRIAMDVNGTTRAVVAQQIRS